MGEPWKPKESGWAGQWDRHRWTVKVVNPPKSAGSTEKIPGTGGRLKSLDEFDPLPWHDAAANRPRRGPWGRSGAQRNSFGAAVALLLAAVLIGAVAGLLL